MAIAVGILGAGTMGRLHADLLREGMGGARLAAVSDPDRQRAAALAAGDATVRIHGDPFDLISDPSLDAVVVASPDETHFAYVSACLAESKQVLCEKPLAPTTGECRALVDMEAASGRALVQVGFMRRFDPAYCEIKSALDAGDIGPPVLLRCVHRNASAPSFFRAGMAITNAMVHEFDACRWLTGREITRIRVDRRAVGDDPLLAAMEMDGGVLASIEVFMNAGYGYDIRTEIVGDRGILEMAHPPAARMFSSASRGFRPPADFVARFADAYRLQMQSWIRAVADGRISGAGAADGLAATSAAECAVKALRDGAWIDVPLPR